ncbi:ectonucleotide pyrophosphatase/phosphodiesterase family member 5-like isoform X2 [Ptychodera flava]|uniref:ectonucleotide pyrophosphatase/phosphodiesterase family member 5-like isoform X2 n=1 Tax=Ptychodera flava TaxID=63121 RepID=UPI00396A3D9D
MMESLISFRSFLTLLLSVVDLSKGLHHGPLTLLISFDGFRWDYLQKVETPNFDVLISDGSFVPDGIVPTFITKTFPNHFTIATGLYEESHGIVANNMYDPVLNEKFHIGGEDSTSSKWWDVGAEPIWVTNQKHGGRTGVYYWPGSETEIMGILPNRYKKYSDTTPFETRIDGVIDWFTDEEEPINLGLLYFNEPDHTGHTSGPESDEILDVIRMCDDTIGYLIQKLQEADLYEKINILITSDHGMTELSPDRLIQLDDYVNPDLYDLVDSSPTAAIYPFDDRNTMAIYNALLAARHPNMTVYLKDSIPDRFHYKHNRRIMPIIAVADEGWCIVDDKTTWLNDTEIEGGHGYDNRYKSMHPFFIAHGPAIKRNFTLEQFNNVDIYPLICKIMEIEAAPNNGSLAIAGTMLRSHDSHGHSSHHSVKPITSSKTLIIGISIAGGIALIAAILLTAMCITHRSYRLKDHVQDVPDKESKQALLSELEDA